MLIIVGSIASGKTTFAKVAENLEYHAFEMGDEVKHLFKKNPRRSTITEFVTEKFNLEGKDFFARRVVSNIKVKHLDLKKVVIVGPRTLEEISYIKKNLGPAKIVLVWAGSKERYERWNAEARVFFEPALTYGEFIERNLAEDSWGLSLVEAKKDDLIVNEEPLHVFHEKLKEYLKRIGTEGDLFRGRFEIIAELGSGQSKETWKALDYNLGRKIVAIKKVLLKSEARKVLHEATVAGPLTHDNIAHILDVDETEGFLVEEFIDGKDLQEIIKESGINGKPIPVSQSAEIFRQLLDALCHAHSHNRLHCDIKPANVMICKGDMLKVKLTDFEVGKITKTGEAKTAKGSNFGSPRYFAPELFEGKPHSKQSDLFSLGIVGYLLFTQKNPFLHPSGYVPINDLIRSKEFRPRPMRESDPTLPPEIDKVILKLLEKEESERYDDVEKVRADFQAIDFSKYSARAVQLKSEA